MKNTNLILMFLFSFVITATKAQQFSNGDLNGTIPCLYSTLPTNWLNVPYTDVNSIASDFNLATCDLTYLTGPVFSTGVNGNPFHGTTFVSGGLSIIGPTNSDTADEGIMQTVSGFTIGNTYSINFYQAVVKQLGALDSSGSWGVYIDNTLAGISSPTFSAAPYNSTTFIWELRTISFTATSTSHTIKFMPKDDDTSIIMPAGLRMGIDSIYISTPPTQIFTINQTICQGQIYLGYSTAGTYIDTFINVNGFDSIRTLNLAVLPSSSTNLIQTICQGSSYLGYTITGTYIDTLISSNGCDSIRTLNLTVLSNSSSNLIQTICQGNSYSGYTSTGTYIDTLISSNGCDSIRTLNLTVLSNSSNGLIQAICQGDSYLGYTSTGIYIDTLISSNGCDSIRTLNLTVIPKFYDTIRHQLCPGERYFSYNIAGIYIDTFLNSLGCDSIRILKLELDEHLCCQIFIPNAFTPNGDNLNDEFLIKGIFDDYNISITDRWGNIIYSSSNTYFGWDGKYKGNEMPIGTYYYLFKYKCNNSSIKMVKGDITLIR